MNSKLNAALTLLNVTDPAGNRLSVDRDSLKVYLEIDKQRLPIGALVCSNDEVQDILIYMKNENISDIYRKCCGWTINRIVANTVDRIYYTTNIADFFISKDTVKSYTQSQKYLHPSVDNKVHIPLHRWDTRVKGDKLDMWIQKTFGTEWWIVCRDIFREYLPSISLKVNGKRAKGTVFPESDQVFNAFMTEPSEIKVVIIGQDPYPTKGDAHGLAFSYSGTGKTPASLSNIFKELQSDVYPEDPLFNPSKDLSDWARQGVFLLNTHLTVDEGLPGSHFNLGWDALTSNIIKRISDYRHNIVFMLWGLSAKNTFKGIINNVNDHLVLEAHHPSPLSAHQGFFGCKHFSKANEYLKSKGITQINW